jgi:hypothetical protein
MAVDLTESDTFTATVTVPEAGDDRKAASVVPAFQALANRTKNLKGRLDDFLADPHTWADDQRFDGDIVLGPGSVIRHVVAAQRKIVLPLKPDFPTVNWLFAPTPTPVWACGSTASALFFTIGPGILPDGGQLVSVSASVNTSIDVTLKLARITYDTSIAGSGTEGTVLTDSFSPTGTEEHILNIGALSALINNATSLFRIAIDPDASGPGLALQWIELVVTDP